MSLIIKRTEQSKSLCKLQAAKSVCLMLLSSKTDESDGNKTFGVYSCYITVASNIFKQTRTLIDKGSVLWFISRKKCDFMK